MKSPSYLAYSLMVSYVYLIITFTTDYAWYCSVTGHKWHNHRSIHDHGIAPQNRGAKTPKALMRVS